MMYSSRSNPAPLAAITNKEQSDSMTDGKGFITSSSKDSRQGNNLEAYYEVLNDVPQLGKGQALLKSTLHML